MADEHGPIYTRRALLRAASWGGLGLVGAALTTRPGLSASDALQTEENELIERLIGRSATESSRLRLEMPPVFSNGFGVPLTLTVDSPMTETDYVRQVHVLAPRNPILVVVDFQYTPQSGRASVSTRVRLAESQNVLAVAQMSDGSVLKARTWVEVTINGCPSN
jgi:sulfur-oxidizing protein SoxY